MDKFLQAITNKKTSELSKQEILQLQYVLKELGYKDKNGNLITIDAVCGDGTKYAFEQLKEDFKIYDIFKKNNFNLYSVQEYTNNIDNELQKISNLPHDEGKQAVYDFGTKSKNMAFNNWDKILMFKPEKGGNIEVDYSKNKEEASGKADSLINNKGNYGRSYKIKFLEDNNIEHKIEKNSFGFIYFDPNNRSHLQLEDIVICSGDKIQRIAKFDDLTLIPENIKLDKKTHNKEIPKTSSKPVKQKENKEITTEDALNCTEISPKLQELETLLNNLKSNTGENDVTKIGGKIVSQYTIDELKEIQKSFQDAGISDCANLEIKQDGALIDPDNIKNITGNISIKILSKNSPKKGK